MSDRVELPRCKTCLHWQAVSPHVNAPDGWRSCARIPDRYDEPAASESLALTCEDDDRSFMLTAPDFGCVMHEGRPTVAPPAPPVG